MTEIIERLNKELERRTKPVQIVAGEKSVYRIPAFVATRMQVSWKNAPFRYSGFRELEPFVGYLTHKT
jgi:transposase-like protein